MKIQLHYLLGDVHFGGHDIHRTAAAAKKILTAAGGFDIWTVCDEPGIGDVNWDTYFEKKQYAGSDVFVFDCGNYRFNIRREQEILENAVSGGAGFVLLHGQQVCYWPEAGMTPWSGFERMAGHVWRDKTLHGDFGNFHITIDSKEHPIVRGLPDFDTRDEVFCRLVNPHHVPAEVLASAYSDPAVISRHGVPGTGRQEAAAYAGQYGKGRTYNQVLGHVWPYYTGHGLGENTLAAWMPEPLRIMFARACEWAAAGTVEKTKDFDGCVKL